MEGDFNPNLWLPQKNKAINISSSKIKNGAANSENIEEIIQELERDRIDMTSSYDSWLQVGFAFSNEYGEAGREYFHRVSKFHPDYNYDKCNKQYDNCLNSKSSGITIKTFFHLAKENGIDISTYHNQEIDYSTTTFEEPKAIYPTLPASIYDNLPKFLKTICSTVEKPHEKDTILLGAITTISGLIPNVYGIYDNRKTHANLYLFLTAKASAGKGILNHCRELAKPVHIDKKEESLHLREKYIRELNHYNANKNKNPDVEKPLPPPVKLLFIPANSSATGVFQLLSDNNGEGIIFETEGDTLSTTFKSDYGNYSDGFRKAFHNEPITYFRRSNNEHAEIEKPKLAAILSGTPKQIQTLIPDAENGLLSRFIYYYIDIKNQWKDVFKSGSSNSLDDQFQEFSVDFHVFHHKLKQTPKILISLNPEQKEKFNMFFSKLQNEYHEIAGDGFLASIRRLGLISFRMMMVLTIIRMMEAESINHIITIADEDFNTALEISETLIVHSYYVFNSLLKNSHPPNQSRIKKFYNKLPESFSTQDYILISKQLNIPNKTAEGYITKLIKEDLLDRIKNGRYSKKAK